MSSQSNGRFLSLPDSENDSKVITKEDVSLSRLIKPSPLQKRLEEQLQKSRKTTTSNGTLLKGHTNGVLSSKNGTIKHSSNPDERPLFQAESDSDEELNVTHFTKPPSVSVTQNSKNLADCTQQLLKDGYRSDLSSLKHEAQPSVLDSIKHKLLDEISDEEDLDLIPPRPVDDRCQCCGTVTLQGCVIS